MQSRGLSRWRTAYNGGALTADHDVQRSDPAADRLRVTTRQLHQRTPSAVLRFLTPRQLDQRIERLDRTRRSQQGFASRREERDLLDALGEVALHRSLDRFIGIFARVRWVEQQAVHEMGGEAGVVEEHLFCRVRDAEAEHPAAVVRGERPDAAK